MKYITVDLWDAKKYQAKFINKRFIEEDYYFSDEKKEKWMMKKKNYC